MITNFFDEGSPFLGHPLLTDERTTAEIDRVLGLRPESPRRVLDLGCGFGRHSVELARRGVEVVAVDPSPAMLDEARRRAGDAEVEVVFRSTIDEVADDHVSDRFDLILCLFTTLGQLDGTETDPTAGSRALLRAARSLLVPGGTFVVEVPDRARALEALITDETLGATQVSRWFDSVRGVLHERFDTGERRFDLAYRLFSSGELIDEIVAAGLEIAEVLPGALVPPPPTFVTVVATRP